MRRIQYSRRVKVPIYDMYLVISFDMEDLLREYPGLCQTLGDFEGLEYAQGMVFDGVEGDTAMIALLIHREAVNMNTMTHESVHAAVAILDGVGVPVTISNQEALAYLTGWVAETVERHWNQLLEKENAQKSKIKRTEDRAGKATASSADALSDGTLCTEDDG